MKALPLLAGTATVLSLLLLWQALSALDVISPFVAPPPSAVLAGFPSLLGDGSLQAAFWRSLWETLLAGVIATALGVPLGVLLHRAPLLARAYEGWVAALAAAPLVLLYPLFLVLIGRNAGTVVAMGALSALPPVVLRAKEGLDAVPPVLRNTGRSLRMTRRQRARLVLLPSAAPVIGNGVRLGLVFALINVVGIEYLSDDGGLGALIVELGERFDYARMFAAIAFVVVASMVFFLLTELAERWMRRG